MTNRHIPTSRLRRSVLRGCLFAFLAAAVFAGSAMLAGQAEDTPASAGESVSTEDLIEAVMFNTGPMGQ